MEDQWKIAFNIRVLRLEENNSKPSDDKLKTIFNDANINTVSSMPLASMQYLNLTNFSGVKHLTNLTNLYCSSNQIGEEEIARIRAILTYSYISS